MRKVIRDGGYEQRRLPQRLLARASLRGREFAWRLADIPEVIETARRRGLVNIGGQLQFRLPDGGTCECYWVEVNTYKSVPKDLPWQDRVDQTAEAALAAFARLLSQYDFLQEGWRVFGPHLQKMVDDGGDPTDAMCFVWYVIAAESGF